VYLTLKSAYSVRSHLEKRVVVRMFYPLLSQRSCHIQHCSCNQLIAMHSMFNIQEFLIFSYNAILDCDQVFFTWEKCVQCALILQTNIVCTGRPLGPRLHRKVRIVCAYTVENALWNTGFLSDDIAAILPCIGRYLYPKYEHWMYWPSKTC